MDRSTKNWIEPQLVIGVPFDFLELCVRDLIKWRLVLYCAENVLKLVPFQSIQVLLRALEAY